MRIGSSTDNSNYVLLRSDISHCNCKSFPRITIGGAVPICAVYVAASSNDSSFFNSSLVVPRKKNSPNPAIMPNEWLLVGLLYVIGKSKLHNMSRK